jgi:hypothetical protein
VLHDFALVTLASENGISHQGEIFRIRAVALLDDIVGDEATMNLPRAY